MNVEQSFCTITADALLDTCKEYKQNGYRLTQIHPVLKQDDTIDLYYSFVKHNEIVNFKIEKIIKGETVIPSVTSLFIACFVYENEAHDLFGVNIEGNLIDFEGKFYRFGEGVTAPMTIISPEQLAAREKAAKIAKAKAAKAAKAAKEAQATKAEKTGADTGANKASASSAEENNATARPATDASAKEVASDATQAPTSDLDTDKKGEE